MAAAPPPPNTNAIQIRLRNKQTVANIGADEYIDPNVCVFAFNWVRDELAALNVHFPAGTQLVITDGSNGNKNETIAGQLTLIDLQKIARNEPPNQQGTIDFTTYGQTLQNNQAVVRAVKDLVRQTVIVGLDWATQYGGFPQGNNRTAQEVPVVIIDMTSLQFQSADSCGRLVLIQQNSQLSAIDRNIYRNVVGDDRPDYQEVLFWCNTLPRRMRHAANNQWTVRYHFRANEYFDKYAYQQFVAKDLLLVMHALHANNMTDVNLKILSNHIESSPQGYKDLMKNNFPIGITSGLTQWFKTGLNRIHAIEFPNHEFNRHIKDLCVSNGVDCYFTTDHCLKQTHPHFMTATTTNCGDPRVPLGSEMGHTSLEANICENIVSNGNKFNAVINTAMRQCFINPLEEFSEHYKELALDYNLTIE